MAGGRYGIELASAEERLGEAVRERSHFRPCDWWPRGACARRPDRCSEQRAENEAGTSPHFFLLLKLRQLHQEPKKFKGATKANPVFWLLLAVAPAAVTFLPSRGHPPAPLDFPANGQFFGELNPMVIFTSFGGGGSLRSSSLGRRDAPGAASSSSRATPWDLGHVDGSGYRLLLRA